MSSSLNTSVRTTAKLALNRIASVRPLWCWKLTCFALASVFGAATALASPSEIDFNRDVRPVFEKHCYACHGPAQQLNGLRLDLKQNALQGGYSGPAIHPGDSSQSRIIHLVSGKESPLNPKGLRMPPGAQPLSAEEVDRLRAWIDAGAPWPDSGGSPEASDTIVPTHWAFLPPKRPDPPSVRMTNWAQNPVDLFVLAKIEKEQLSPSPEADKSTLIRRVSLDLIGLPPTPNEVESFLRDTSSDAYERLVDRLLASKHYGEKWARHWLDLARYADSDGYEEDRVRPHAWRYRHWVIDALNRDMPFDQFTIEQIAGDLLPNATVKQQVGTGFHRNTLKNREGGVDPEQFRFEEVIDRANTVGTVWLGLTVGCAQCHDHKYDPLTQKDYYRLFAFFDNAEEINIDAPLPGEMGPYLRTHGEYRAKRRQLLEEYGASRLQEAWEKKLIEAADSSEYKGIWDVAFARVQVYIDGGERILRTAPGERTTKEADVLTDHFVENYASVITKEEFEQLRFKELKEKLDALTASFPSLSQAGVVRESKHPRETFVHVRGAFDRKGIGVKPGTPSFLSPAADDSIAPRLALARWLVSADNPLVARVAMNRMWQELFGQGLVKTSDNFGLQGEPPTHPKLLDWLATEFQRRHWSMKRMNKLIVMSATYRQASSVSPALLSRDPDNTLLARQARLRLPSELIRDSALAAGGLLYPVVGGKSVHPPQPEGVSSFHFKFKWPESTGKDRYRRGLYIHFQRTAPYPFLMNFDAPDSNVTACRRERSNTPLQSLNLLNDPVFFEAAQAMALRVLRESPGEDFSQRLDYLYQLCLARNPAPEETERMLSLLTSQTKIFEDNPETAHSLLLAPLDGFSPIELAGWIGISRVMLNLNEFITRE